LITPSLMIFTAVDIIATPKPSFNYY